MFFRRAKEKTHQHIHYLRTLQGVIGMLRNSENTESVFDIEEGLRDIEATQLAVDYALSIPEIRALTDERYLQPPPDIDALLQLPSQSLGYSYARHISDNGFDPDYYRKIEVQDDRGYLALRTRQTHDIWHVVIGIDAKPIGELGVKAFELAQLRRPMAAVITAGGLLRYLIKEPAQLPDVMEALHHGYTAGSNAKPLLAEKWEEQWERPLEQVRADLNVIAGPYAPGSSGADGQ